MIGRRSIIIVMLASISMILHSQVRSSEKASIFIASDKKQQSSENNVPMIEIISPGRVEGNIIDSPDREITIVGKVNGMYKLSHLLVEGKSTEIDEYNTFYSVIPLSEGTNEISILAVDSEGDSEESKLNVRYSPKISFGSIETQGNYYALIIGINEYQDPGIDDLESPINDASRLTNVLLSRYTFEKEHITFLKNPTRGGIIKVLDELSNKISSEDNLLIYYAGHGQWDENSNIGYWLPSDAKQTNKAAWFRNSTLIDYLREIDSKHTLLIADACFGGSIFKTRKAFGSDSKAINMIYELPSRKAMTSGALDEVPDRSTFSMYLIDRLSTNTSVYLRSEKLFNSFRMAVLNNGDSVPQYGEINNVGDEGGDFVFIRR